MRYLLVQPYADGPRRYEDATVVADFESIEEAFDRLEWYARRLKEQAIAPDAVQLFVVNEHRRPVLRGQ